MEGCRKINTLALLGKLAALCVIVLLSSCASIRREQRKIPCIDTTLKVSPDSSQFVPLHPPVVVPKNWREAKYSP